MLNYFLCFLFQLVSIGIINLVVFVTLDIGAYSNWFSMLVHVCAIIMCEYSSILLSMISHA